MLPRCVICFFLLACCCGGAVAQSSTNQSAIAGAEKSSPDTKSSVMLGTPEAEMLARRELKFAEKERRDNLERAREATQLATEVQNSFLKNQTLSRTEIKKIERLEKLTRRIREEAGGSDGDVTIENPPRQLETALQRIAELSDELRQGVEKTPRQVVSAQVIERTNELLEIIRFVRAMTR